MKHQFSSKHVEKSYDAYLRMRRQWKKKGYAMDRALSKKAFDENHQLAASLGEKNIARAFAAEDRQATAREIQKMRKSIKEGFRVNENVRDEQGKIIKIERKVIIATDKEDKYEKSEEWAKLKKQGYKIVTVENYDAEFLKKNGLKAAYNDLREKGYTAREAGAVIDESYE